MLKKLKALLGAESGIQVREKIVRTLQAEEKQLGELIIDRVTAERLLVEAETAVTLGEQSEATAAQHRVDASLGAIHRQTRKIAGLRSRLAAQAPELEEQRNSVRSAMPSHVDAIKGSFADEWGTGVAAFGALLGKRAAIEGLIGKLPLADPQPLLYELPDSMAGPWRTIQDIDAALNEVAGWSHAATWPAVDAMGGLHHTYDPTAVYVITNPNGGAEVGTLVMDGSFIPGFLNHMVQIAYAAPLASLDWQNSLESGRRAAQRVLAELQQERQQADCDRDAPRLIQYDHEKANTAAAANKRINNNDPATPVSSGEPIKWGSGPQRKVTEGM